MIGSFFDVVGISAVAAVVAVKNASDGSDSI